VPLDEPTWWYATADSRAAKLLAPLASVYSWFATRHLLKTHPTRAPHPVICIGNFTAGGTGKTPLTRFIAELLRTEGFQPIILTRGYGGTLKGPHFVNPAIDHAAQVGDEPLLLAATNEVLIARDRLAGARAIALQKRPKNTVILMDDGLQNPSLFKDLTIAIVDGARGLGNGRVIPAGPLRAPIKIQASLADAIVINMGAETAGNTDTEGTLENHHITWLRQNFTGQILTAHVHPANETKWLKSAPAPVIAYAGIANPQRFLKLLRSLGVAIHAECLFRDHQQLTQNDAIKLLNLADHHDATLITTEKDIVRLPAYDDGSPLARLRTASQTLPIELTFTQQDNDRLKLLIRNTCQKSLNHGVSA